MSGKGRSRGRRSKRRFCVLKPNGKIDEQVRRVGPERFGIVTVDCAKARSKWMLCDFYGEVLLEPAELEHTAAGFRQAIEQLKQAEKQHGLQELLVAVERTGIYHTPVQRAYRKAGYAVRVIHPFATKQFRQPASPGVKTDDVDLAALHRACVVGFALCEEPLDENARQLRLLVRHRRDLVKKNAALRCQIREHLHAILPGYAALFGKTGDHLWKRALAIPIALHFGVAQRIIAAGEGGMGRWLRAQQIRFQRRSLLKIVAWAEDAAPADPDVGVRQLVLAALYADWQEKQRQIAAAEGEIAGRLVHTPYLLLLAIPGINVVSAGEFAGEMGPISAYANANAITGRAGLFAGRYQSDEVDKTGLLVRSCNKKLRAAVLMIADNLLTCNDYFKGRSALWRLGQVDPRLQRVRVAKRFTRLAYAMVAGGQIFPHPCCREPNYVLEKLFRFQLAHDLPWKTMQANLLAAQQQLPANVRPCEAEGLKRQVQKLPKRNRTASVRHIGDVLALVVARLLGEPLQLTDEDQASSQPAGGRIDNALVPMALDASD